MSIQYHAFGEMVEVQSIYGGTTEIMKEIVAVISDYDYSVKKPPSGCSISPVK